jgi:hypothetical protein
MPENHFLDANVIIGSLIPWDTQWDRSVRYFETQGMFRHTSLRVYGECTGVFEGSRRELLRYLKEFYRRFNQSSDPMYLDHHIQQFTADYSAGFDDEKMKRIVANFVRMHMTDLRNVALGGEQSFGDFKQSIRDAITYALNELANRCIDTEGAEIYLYSCCPIDHTPLYASEYRMLFTSMSYAPDVNVLLDSYHIKETRLQGTVHFITTDFTHIIQHKVTIERVLPGIIIFNP